MNCMQQMESIPLWKGVLGEEQQKKEACGTQSTIPWPKFGRWQKWLKTSNSQVSVGETQNIGGFFTVISLLK